MTLAIDGIPKHERHNIDRAIVFVTDKGYLVQSIIAASQVAAQPDVLAVADILIFLIDIPSEERGRIVQELGESNFNFFFLSSDSFLASAFDNLPPLHVPRATLGRLAIEAVIPQQYNHILYLDGDIQVLRSISNLINYTVPEGRILASCDRLDYGGKYNSPKWYMKRLHISCPAHYFNAGIIAASRPAWRRHSAAAMDFLKQHPEICKHHDQSALNAINSGRRDILSFEYNFNTWFKDAYADELIKPAIVHFTGPLKPWNSVSGPWSNQYRSVYESFIENHPFFSKYLVLTQQNDEPNARFISPQWVRASIKKVRSRLIRARQHVIVRRYMRDTEFVHFASKAPQSFGLSAEIPTPGCSRKKGR